jgi:hypothetical protein
MSFDPSRRALMGAAGALALGSIGMLAFARPKARVIKVVAKKFEFVPGQTASLQFTPDRTGSFTFLCDVFCGSGHEDMNGTLIVS